MTKIYGRFLLNVIYLAGDTHRAPKPTKRVKIIPLTRVAWFYSLAANNFLGKVMLNVLVILQNLQNKQTKCLCCWYTPPYWPFWFVSVGVYVRSGLNMMYYICAKYNAD